MHEVLVNRLGGLSLPRKSVVRLTDRPDMTLDVYRGRKTKIQPKDAPALEVYPAPSHNPTTPWLLGNLVRQSITFKIITGNLVITMTGVTKMSFW